MNLMNKMKRLAAWVLMVGMVLGLASCGSKAQLKAGLNLEELAKQLTSGLTFEDKDMAPLAEQLFERYMDQVEKNDVKAYYIYAGGGSTAEEIALFEAKDEDAAKRIEQAMNKRYEYFRTSFGNYTPEQLVNLEKPALVRNSGYVFAVLSKNNDKAREIINGWIAAQK